MSTVKIHRGRGKLYAGFIKRFSRLSYYLFAAGGDFSDIILRRIDFKENKRILDIGSGVGNLLAGIKQRLDNRNNGSLVVGADYSKEMIKIAQNRFGNIEGKPFFVNCDASCLPFKPGAFDICFNILLLHHLPAALKIQVLAEVARVLAPDGLCVLMDMDRPTTFLGWLIASLRWHVSTIRDNFKYGLKDLYSQAGLTPEWQIKKLGLFSYYFLRKSSWVAK